MKKLLLLLLLALPLPLTAQTAKIKIDVDRTIGEIDPKIYGVFMEPIHFSGRRMGLSDTSEFNTLYGSLYDPLHPLRMRTASERTTSLQRRRSASPICDGPAGIL